MTKIIKMYEFDVGCQLRATLDGVRRTTREVSFSILLEKVDHESAFVSVGVHSDSGELETRCDKTCPLECLSDVTLDPQLLREIIIENKPEDVGNRILTAIATHYTRLAISQRKDAIYFEVSINGFDTFAEFPLQEIAPYLIVDP